MRDVFSIGEKIRARVTYTDPDTDALTDPSSVTVVVRTPAGVLTTYTYGVDAALSKVSAGVYQVLITLSEVGTWKWKWTGSATEKTAVDFDECDCEKEAGF
jgi:hypothetical protein